MRALAFDFGLSATGVAAGQSVTGTANGVTTLRFNDGQPNWRTLKALIEDHSPDVLVVGLPLNMDGTESEMSERARAFADALHRRTDLTVHMHDERLTSQAAKGEIEDARAQGRAGSDHELAACYILESWLESWLESGSRAR